MDSSLSRGTRSVAVGLAALAALALSAPALPALTVERVVEQTFKVDGPPEVSVRSFNGSVSLRLGAADQVRVKATKYVTSLSGLRAERELDRIRLTLEQTGRVIRLETEEPDGAFRWGWGGRGVRFEVELPPTSSLDVQTSNGPVRGEKLGGFGRFKTTNGTVTLSDCAGDYEVLTSNGSVTAELKEGTLQARTSNGRIRVRGIAKSIVARTTNGRIEVDLEGAAEIIQATTSNGAITVAGRADRIEAHSSNAPLQIELSDGVAEVSATTSNGAIDFAGTLRGDNEFVSSNGSITLRLARQSAFHLDARTNAGGISSEIPLERIEVSDRRSLIGSTAGDPTANIKVRLNSGAIRLERL